MKAATIGILAALSVVIISIHAAREGGDRAWEAEHNTFYNISIHAAREGGDAERACRRQKRIYFNPRRP